MHSVADVTATHPDQPAAHVGDRVRTAQPADTQWQPLSSVLRVRASLYLLLLDGAAILGAFSLVAWLRNAEPGNAAWLVFTAVLLPVYVAVAANFHAYSGLTLQDPLLAIKKGVRSLAVAIGVLILIAFYLKSAETFPRLTIAAGSLLAASALALLRFWFVTYLPRIVGGNPFSVILIRDGDQPIPPGQFSMVMAADSELDPDRHDPVMFHRLSTALGTADRVVVTCPPERRAAWAGLLRGGNILGEIVIPELAALVPLGLRANGDNPAVVVAVGPLNLFDRAVKRGFDIAVAGTALLLLGLPLLAIALWIRLDSRGPALFIQTRIGRGNAMFRMFKFRSMTNQASDGAGHRSTARDDDRITRAGRFIRRTSIDELPQLLNVLAGSMSIVGPRPHAPGSRAADKLFWEVDARYWDRHATKPGLTGLAQIRGYRGATLAEADLRNRLQADLEYLENWSIWRDARIMVLTARVLLHRNAF